MLKPTTSNRRSWEKKDNIKYMYLWKISKPAVPTKPVTQALSHLKIDNGCDEYFVWLTSSPAEMNWNCTRCIANNQLLRFINNSTTETVTDVKIPTMTERIIENDLKNIPSHKASPFIY